jgi:hypothetical protein
LSDAVALIVTVPDTVAPLPGDVMLTVGAVVSGGGPFDTVTVTGEDSVLFPAASLARAVRLCEPFDTAVVSHVTE